MSNQPEQLKFSVESVSVCADLFTPVSLYSQLRQLFTETLLLESGDSRGVTGSISYLCADPLARFSLHGGRLRRNISGRAEQITEITGAEALRSEFAAFQASFVCSVPPASSGASSMLGLFGYTGYHALPYLETIEFAKPQAPAEDIPAIYYALYRYVLRFDHFRQTLEVVRLVPEKPADAADDAANQPIESVLTAAQLLARLRRNDAPQHPFCALGEELAETTDADFAALVVRAQQHIQRGDVFQVVPSRKFRRAYRGDEFQVYRALRALNPSPFMFFYDYGAFALAGSSPEAQLLIKDGTAWIHPIAGTFPRGADAASDRALAEQLAQDPKEIAEHVMLVDLARNDLYRHCNAVRVESFREVQFFSHVIHLVSQVSGRLRPGATAWEVLADVSPAGTLSGAPKYRAMQLIHEWETTPRNFYGGAVGFFGLDGNCLHAIMIRTLLARQRTLFYQAGAGIVASSVPENEVREVGHKLRALRQAVETATLSSQ